MIKLLFVVNNPEFFVSHRLAIGIAAVKAGYQVSLACPDGQGIDEIKAAGISVYIIPVSRTAHGWLSQYRFMRTVLSICRDIRPDVCHMITLKTFLVAGFAVKWAGVPSRIGSISGLGYLFISDKWKTKLFRAVLRPVFKWVMADLDTKIIFQNSADKKTMSDYIGINESNTLIIKGSGVDLTQFSYTAELEGVPTVVMASRLLIDKGVMEFLESARELKARGIEARFVLAGEPDVANPVSIDQTLLQSFIDDESIEWIGHSRDIAGLFANSNLVVLPSYREGFPKVLIEAAACGRAVVTTDVPGCRDAVIEGETGLLARVKDSQNLAQQIEALLANPRLRASFGKKAYQLARTSYAIESVVESHVHIYQSTYISD